MNLQKTLMAHRVTPRWVGPLALLGVGLFFGWEAIRPYGPGLVHRDGVESALKDSAESLMEVKEYLDHTTTLSQALKDGDQEALKRLIAEQETLNQRMKKRREELQASEEMRNLEKAVTERRARITLGIAAGLLVVLSVWNLFAGLSKNNGKS